MFKIGDRVIVKGIHELSGRMGTVVLLPDSTGDESYIRKGYGIEFDEPHSLLHSCRGKTKKDCGAWVMPEDLKLIKSEKKEKERKMFKIGDKVRVIKDYYSAKEGDEGIIKALPGKNGSSDTWEDCYSVEFPTWECASRGHSCGHTVPSGNGHWVKPECLELIKSKAEKIVITRDGKTTLARLYDGKTVVKSAEAKCGPRDEFSFIEGARLAFERLMGEEREDPPKFDKSMLTDGRFGCMSYGMWFVVVGDKLIYQRGGFDTLDGMNAEGKFPIGYEIKYVVEAVSFDHAKCSKSVIWKAPDFELKKVTNNA